MSLLNSTKVIAEPNKQEYFVERTFYAPRELVFKAFTTPELLVQWFLPKELNMQIEIMDCKAGGSYKHFHKHPNGMKFGFRGVYHDVIVPQKISMTSEFEGLPQKMDAVLETITFHELKNGNRNSTKVVIHTVCPSVQFRDRMLSSGFETTIGKAHQLLDNLLAIIQ